MIKSVVFFSGVKVTGCKMFRNRKVEVNRWIAYISRDNEKIKYYEIVFYHEVFFHPNIAIFSWIRICDRWRNQLILK